MESQDDDVQAKKDAAWKKRRQTILLKSAGVEKPTADDYKRISKFSNKFQLDDSKK